MAYLIGPGSVAVFVLVLYVLARWSASATSYAFLLFPLVAIVLGGLLLAEPVQPSFLVGGAIVLSGVYIGAALRLGIELPSRQEALPRCELRCCSDTCRSTGQPLGRAIRTRTVGRRTAAAGSALGAARRFQC